MELIELLLTIIVVVACVDIVLTNRLAHRYKQRLMTLQWAYYEVLGQNTKLTSNTGRVPQEIG